MSSCAVCLKGISDAKWVTSEETKKEYHNECFCCAECKKVVNAKERYFEIPSPSVRVGSIVRCAECQKNYNCTSCGGTIAVLVHKKHNGLLWHTDCWRCDSCNGSLGKTPQAADDFPRKLFCVECDGKGFRGVCSRCRGGCKGDFTEALDRQWHARCLTCHACQAPFPDGNFYVVDGEPACAKCAGA
jgi:hypothetical protein